MKGARVAIAGGGIGGLTAALALLAAGQQVRVYERSTTPGEAGAGVTITPNATRVLVSLGLGEWIETNGSRPATGVIRSGIDGAILAWNTRREDIEARYGAAYFQVHRADLHAELLARLRAYDPYAVSAGDAFQGFRQNGDAVHARFARSGIITADALIGADGIRSTLRNALFGGGPPAFTGYVAHRGLVPAAALPTGLIDHASCLYVGPGRLFLRYLLRGGTLVNFVSIGRAEAWTEESWSVPAAREDLMGALDGWLPEVRAIAAAVPVDRLFAWGLFDRPPLSQWCVGRVALLGDAAHPTLPFLGQGAVMAIEDAAVLGRAFDAAESVEEALSRYQNARIGRAGRVMELSRDNGLRLVTQAPDAYRAGVFATPRSLGLMDYDALTAPL